MTTNYWAHQDITRKNFTRAGGDLEMLKRLELQSVNPINRLVMVLFYQQVLSPAEIYWVFSCPNHLLNTCIVGVCLLNGFEIVCSVLGLVSSPLLSWVVFHLMRWERECYGRWAYHHLTITSHHCVVMKGNEVLWSEQTTHSTVEMWNVIKVMKCLDLKIKSKCSHSILLLVSPSALALLSPDICWVTGNGKKWNI